MLQLLCYFLIVAKTYCMNDYLFEVINILMLKKHIISNVVVVLLSHINDIPNYIQVKFIYSAINSTLNDRMNYK